MSDLISRQTVLDILQEEKSLRCGYDADIAILSIEKKIKEQPTAYDVSKVEAELKEKKDEASIEAGKRSVRIGEDEYEDDPYYEGKKHAYGHAIEMVRKGGAE